MLSDQRTRVIRLLQTRESRTRTARRLRDRTLGPPIVGGLARALNSLTSFTYLSYVPDSVRIHGSLRTYRQRVRAWLLDNSSNNAGDITRLMFLIQNVQQLLEEGVAGNFAELGVYKGHSAQLLASMIATDSTPRKLFLFDTFAGFDERDIAGVDSHVPQAFTDTSVAGVQSRVGHLDLCEYRVGFFPDTAEDLADDVRFALVHVDCDLHEPALAALEFFYTRLSPGALFILHDFSSGFWPGIRQACNEFLADKPERLVLIPDKSGTAAFRKL